MKYYRFTIALVLFFCVSCRAAKRRMVCEALDDIFCEEAPGVSTAPAQRGPPGKRGATGPKGDKGSQGAVGVIDPREVNRLDQELSNIDNLVKGDLERQSRRIANMEDDYVPRRLLEICDVFYGGNCFALLMSTRRMNMEEGRAACREIDGKPANIYSEDHFEKIRALLLSRIYIAHGYNHIWTGMTIDIPARRIRLSTGSWAPYTRWYPNRPFTPARAHVGIHVDGNPNSANHGMFDEHGTYKLLGVLCEI